MKRLIETGLMYGNLVHVGGPLMVARYNRALKRLLGRTTTLTDFYVDISGFSPEVAQELGDPLYLNPNGVNRQFILMTPDQKYAPLLDAKFSFSRDVLRDYIDTNEAALFALTARDAVVGELLNSVFSADDPAHLLNIKRITVQADTTEAVLRNAGKLTGKIDEFMTRDDAWQDQALIDEMIALAETTGDVTRNPVALQYPDQTHDSFWTAHFGGAFIKRYDGKLTIIAHDPEQFSHIKNAKVMGLDDKTKIAKYLFANGLVEPILTAQGIDSAAIVQRKMDMLIAATLAQQGVSDIPLGSGSLRRLGRRLGNHMPPAVFGLQAVFQSATDGGDLPKIRADDPTFFYLLRATAGGHGPLVNRLLAAMAPGDFRQLFICHKESFYDAYNAQPDAMKDFVVNFLQSEYMGNKAATRQALFGHMPQGPWSTQTAPDPMDDMVAAVGPWGAVKRG